MVYRKNYVFAGEGLGDASVSVIITPPEYVSIKSVLFFFSPSRVFYSTQNFRNEIRKKRAFSAAVARQVDVQLSQTRVIVVYMQHNGGFFSAMKCHGIRFPPSLQQSRARDTNLAVHGGVRHAALREEQAAAGCI